MFIRIDKGIIAEEMVIYEDGTVYNPAKLNKEIRFFV